MFPDIGNIIVETSIPQSANADQREAANRKPVEAASQDNQLNHQRLENGREKTQNAGLRG